MRADDESPVWGWNATGIRIPSFRGMVSAGTGRCTWMWKLLATFASLMLLGRYDAAHAETPIPDSPRAILRAYCIDCHDQNTSEGDVHLDIGSVNWSSSRAMKVWEDVLFNCKHGIMPPHDADQPTDDERKVLADWIDRELTEHMEIGGTAPRRLNRNEYLRTIRQLVYLHDYELPPGFPGDTEVHGFDNIGEGLVMAPSHLAAYSKVASEIADLLYPQPRKAVASKVQQGTANDLVLSFSASMVKEGKSRLASKARDIMRSCTWPQQHQAKVSGVYRITVDASCFEPREGDLPMVLEVRARPVDAPERSRIDRFRVLKEIEVTSESMQSATFEAELYKNETILFRWRNAEFDHNDLKSLVKLMTAWFERDQRWLAAWQQTVFPGGLRGRAKISTLRGLNGWNILNKALRDPRLDMSQATMDSAETKELLRIFGTVGGGTHNLGDALCHYYFNHGPSLQLHGYKIEGPSKLVDSDLDQHYQRIARRIAGTPRDGLRQDEFARKMLARFLPRAFRRPVDSQTIDAYVAIAAEHWRQGHSFNEGMHLLLRNILISPQFLYRSLRPGKLDDHDLAARLSYFLTQSAPDDELAELANSGRLSDAEELRKQAMRLLPTRREHPLVEAFTGQWLDTRELSSIMPDPKFKFAEREINIAKAEVELFFTEMIKANRPVRDFIDPDFTYTAPYFGDRIYKMDQLRSWDEKKKQSVRIQRFEIPRGSRYGGLLGQSAIMMTTANGVDTQPVLRGVWVMENILGMAPPEPPEDVPALTPDTQGTTTPREMLAAHTQEPACANCHQHIDPLGFVLENFDPVGQWRDYWPGTDQRIDATGVLPDGTEVRDVSDLKRWLVDHEELFAKNLAEKLMVYGTGRALNYVERKEVEQIVKQNVQANEGFRDLILDLVASETFQTK